MDEVIYFIGGQRDVWDFVVTAAGVAVVLPKLVWPFLLSFLQAGRWLLYVIMNQRMLICECLVT
ncbi:MAG: hypothetical protein JKX71_07515 [Amylibacter sp.]|nr:hypothetical protein [Amylibacter sp.]